MEPIELTLHSGHPVTISALAVAFFQPEENMKGTIITFVGGTTIAVSESYETMAETFNPERQAAEPC